MQIVVSGGGTIAPVDDVRVLTNVSTGRLAAAITEAFLARGDSVWHIQTPTALVPLRRLALFDLETPSPETELERLSALRRRWIDSRDRLHLLPLQEGTVGEYARILGDLLRSQPIDVAVLAMAASDYEPEPRPGKIDSEAESMVIRCRRAPKVIRSVRETSPNVFLVGFKLLSGVTLEELISRAAEAAQTNRADLTVANDLQTLREGRHTLHLVEPDGSFETLGPGDDLADRLVDGIADRVSRRRATGMTGG